MVVYGKTKKEENERRNKLGGRNWETYLMGSCWKREVMSPNGSATTTSWSSAADDEEEEAEDVTSSKESDSNDDPLEIPETEDDVEEEEEEKEPTRSSYWSWTGPFFGSSSIISNVVFFRYPFVYLMNHHTQTIYIWLSTLWLLRAHSFIHTLFSIFCESYKWNGRFEKP